MAALRNNETVSRYIGYKAHNVWSGSKHLESHEYIGQPLLYAVVLTTETTRVRSARVGSHRFRRRWRGFGVDFFMLGLA